MRSQQRRQSSAQCQPGRVEEEDGPRLGSQGNFAQLTQEAEEEKKDWGPCLAQEVYPMSTWATSILLVACWWLRRAGKKTKMMKQRHPEQRSTVEGKTMQTEPTYLVELGKECFPEGRVTEVGANGNCFWYSLRKITGVPWYSIKKDALKRAKQGEAQAWVQRQRRQRAWADERSLRHAAAALGKAISVQTEDGRIWSAEGGADRIYLQLKQHHYRLVIPCGNWAVPWRTAGGGSMQYLWGGARSRSPARALQLMIKGVVEEGDQTEVTLDFPIGSRVKAVKAKIAELRCKGMNTFSLAKEGAGACLDEEDRADSGNYEVRDLGGALVYVIPRRPWIAEMRAYQDFVRAGQTIEDLRQDVARRLRVRMRQVTFFKSAASHEILDPQSTEIPEQVHYEVTPYMELPTEERTPVTSDDDSYDQDELSEPSLMAEAEEDADPTEIRWMESRIGRSGGPREVENFLLQTPRGWRPTRVSFPGTDTEERALRPWCAGWLECHPSQVQLCDLPERVSARFGAEQITVAIALPTIAELTGGGGGGGGGGGKKHHKKKKGCRIVLKSRSRTPPEDQARSQQEEHSNV